MNARFSYCSYSRAFFLFLLLGFLLLWNKQPVDTSSADDDAHRIITRNNHQSSGNKKKAKQLRGGSGPLPTIITDESLQVIAATAADHDHTNFQRHQQRRRRRRLWDILQTFNASDHPYGQYGSDIATSSDGRVIAVGSPAAGPDRKGLVQVFQREANESIYYQKGQDIRGPVRSSSYGNPMALDGSGNRLVLAVGEANAVRVYDFDSNTTTWELKANITFTGIAFLRSDVAVSNDGSVVAASSNNGDEFVGMWSVATDGSYTLIREFRGFSGDIYGASIALSGDGKTLLVGAPGGQGEIPGINNAGYVEIFTFFGTSFSLSSTGRKGSRFFRDDYFGRTVALSDDGSVLAVNALDEENGDAGRTEIFEYAASRFYRKGDAIFGERSGDQSGGRQGLALNADGSILAVGANYYDGVNGTHTGQAKIYSYNSANANWEQRGQTIEGKGLEDEAGYAVALSDNGHVVTVGAPEVFQVTGGYVQIFDATPSAAPSLAPSDVPTMSPTFSPIRNPIPQLSNPPTGNNLGSNNGSQDGCCALLRKALTATTNRIRSFVLGLAN